MNDQSQQIRVGVIMAGGSGERFWPLSRKLRPKQLLRLSSDTHTMLAEAVHRLSPTIPSEHVYVVTGGHLVEPIRKGQAGLPDENVIAEPCKRNTAGALAYAAAHMLAKYGGDGSKITMAVATADHTIGDAETFRATIDTAMTAAEQQGALATLGVAPTRPETGYGYIQLDPAKPVDTGNSRIEAFAVSAFHEKPNRERAEEFVSSDRYLWNSGMFFWTIAAFLDELESAQPPLAGAVRAMADAMKGGNETRVREVFEGLENISIDYALMERARTVIVARADFSWDDVGAWPALDRTFPHDGHGNVVVGDPVLLDVEDSIVYNECGSENVALAVLGAEEMIIVVTDDAVLVAPKDRAQEIRGVVRELQRRKAKQT